MTSEDEAKTYTLTLAFDLRQISTALQFDIHLDDAPTMKRTGRAAGAYQLDLNDQIAIKIAASFNPETTLPDAISIQDLILVCTPVNRVHQSDLSPFFSDTAGILLRNWERQEDGAVTNELLDQTAEPTATTNFTLSGPTTEGLVPDANDTPRGLVVKALTGEWQISGYLSVRVTGVEASQSFSRVYDFDPTVIVGTGGEAPR
jgi:hypothetical protein